MRPLRPKAHDEGGAVALLVTAMSMLLFGVAALVVDLGQARVMRQAAQEASDAAALAAMNHVYRYVDGEVVADIEAAALEAKRYVETSYYDVDDTDWNSCVDAHALAHQPLTGIDCISFDDDDQPTQARIVVPAHKVNFSFASIFGATAVSVSAKAQAKVRTLPGSDCGLCVVGDGDSDGDHDVQNGKVQISGGNIAMNGSVDVNANGLVSTDGDILIEGEAKGSDDDYDPDPKEGQSPIEDPLAGYPLPPDYSGLTIKTDPCGPSSVNGPGIYAGVNFPNNNCTLQPGLYVITGEWDVTGNTESVVTGTGVTLYFTCGSTSLVRPCNAPGEAGGWLDAAGNGNVNITAPETGPTKGFAIIYDRLNKSQLNLSGNGSGAIVGTIYALSAKLRYDGNACSQNKSLIIVDALELNGANSCLVSVYDQTVNAPVLPDDLHLSE